jgi:hypothetical protein
MKSHLAVSLALVAAVLAVAPGNAQFLQKLEQGLIGGQGQAPGYNGSGQQQMPPGYNGSGQQQLQPMFVGNVNLPPGQYMMSNVQTGQAFYVSVQGGQMYMSNQADSQQTFSPNQGLLQPQQGGVGGLIKSGLGSFLKNQMTPQQQAPVQPQF